MFSATVVTGAGRTNPCRIYLKICKKKKKKKVDSDVCRNVDGMMIKADSGQTGPLKAFKLGFKLFV